MKNYPVTKSCSKQRQPHRIFQKTYLPQIVLLLPKQRLLQTKKNNKQSWKWWGKTDTHWWRGFHFLLCSDGWDRSKKMMVKHSINCLPMTPIWLVLALVRDRGFLFFFLVHCYAKCFKKMLSLEDIGGMSASETQSIFLVMRFDQYCV